MNISSVLARLAIGLAVCGSSACAGGTPRVPSAVVPQSSTSTEALTLDFAACVPKREVVYGAMGSTTYEIIGPQGTQCLMNYGTEIEDPNWNGLLDMRCTVPRSLKSQAFVRTNTGANFAPLAPYCKK